MIEPKITSIDAPNSAGFTLIEMLVVITLIALMAALAAPRLRQPPDTLRLETTARTLASALRLSRALALTRNEDVSLRIDVDRKTFESPAVAVTRIDPDIAIDLVFAAPERRRGVEGAIRFFPDGSSSGGNIGLTLGARRARILVNWLTGEPRLDLTNNGT